jgi:Pyruvate/2-oxoacid:ferredoxin oxidoreductase gamma subunit
MGLRDPRRDAFGKIGQHFDAEGLEETIRGFLKKNAAANLQVFRQGREHAGR